MVDANALLDVGYVCGAHGVRGAITVQLHDPDSEIVARRRARIGLGPKDEPASVHWYVVEHAASIPGQAGRWRVSLEGLVDRDQAELLKGAQLRVERGALPDLPDDEYYLADTVGRPVLQLRPNREPLEAGIVVGFMHNGAQDLLEVEWESPDGRPERWLFPALPGFVIDVTPEAVVVDVPWGMMPDALEALR